MSSYNLEGGVIDGALKWRNHDVEDKDDTWSYRPPGVVDFSGLKVRQLSDDKGVWPETGNAKQGSQAFLQLHGFVYDTLGPESAADNEWLELVKKDSQFSLQPYEQLFHVFRAMGRERDAAEIAIAKQKAITERIRYDLSESDRIKRRFGRTT